MSYQSQKKPIKRHSNKVINKLQTEFGSDPKDILAYIGPGIHKESYIIDRPAELKILPDWQRFLTEIGTDKIQIDIVGYNQAQMLKAGLLPENIFIDPTDTATSNDYFSHYRSERITGEPEGRFATVVVLK